MVLARLVALALATTSLLACGDDPQAPDDGVGGTTVDPPLGGGGAGPGDGGGGAGSSAQTISLTLEPFEVPPGGERQVCKTVNLPVDVDVDVVRMVSTMQGTSHHLNVYKVLAGDVAAPVTPEESTVHDCSPAAEQLDGSAAYIFGAATPERSVDMPDGVAFHLSAGQRLILEQHVINPTGEPLFGGATFDLVRAADDAVIEHHADIVWMANWSIYLPPNQETAITEHCTLPFDAEVFGLMSHTHKLGTTFTIDRWSSSDTENVYTSTDWAHPIYQTYDPPLPVAAGEGFQWTCNYSNTTGSAVSAGPSANDEMCMMFAYAYPTGSLSAEPVQCNKPF